LALGFLATKARPDVLTLSLPADLAAGLADALDHLRATAPPARRPPMDELAGRLGAADSAREPLELTAPRDLLGELLAVAIDETADRLGQQGTRLVRGEASPAELRAGLEELSGLLDLLETVQAS
jgi:hypothetical protein